MCIRVLGKCTRFALVLSLTVNLAAAQVQVIICSRREKK